MSGRLPGEATLAHVCYWYPTWTGRPAAALWDVALQFRPGITVIGGDSGSGKSTLLRVLNGLVPHFYGGRFAGQATVAGHDVTITPTHVLARHVGLVPQEFQSSFVRATVEREVAFAGENLALAPARIRAQVDDALHQVGIGHLGGRRLSTLSGGERQRVALAAALAVAPTVVAMDEPTSQLDGDGIGRLLSVVAGLARAGSCVVIAEQRTHRLPTPSTALHMAGGRLVDPPPATASPAARSGPARRGPAAGDAAWELQRVTAGIGALAVVDDVDLAGAGGEVVAMVGPNGAGKTTLLRTIAGLLPPLAGRVVRRPGRIAYLPQDPGALLHRRSVLGEVRQTLRWTDSDDDPMAVLEALHLGDLAERDPRDLSGGQRQRAALATVLTGHPAVVLLDEPTQGMDAAARAALSELLRQVTGAGGSVVVATHDLDLVATLAHRVVRVAGGRAVVDDDIAAPWATPMFGAGRGSDR